MRKQIKTIAMIGLTATLFTGCLQSKQQIQDSEISKRFTDTLIKKTTMPFAIQQDMQTINLSDEKAKKIFILEHFYDDKLAKETIEVTYKITNNKTSKQTVEKLSFDLIGCSNENIKSQIVNSTSELVSVCKAEFTTGRAILILEEVESK